MYSKWVKKRVQGLALILCWGLLLGSFVPSAQAFSMYTAKEGYITRGEIVEILLAAADDYQPNLQKGQIIRGDGQGNLYEERLVTRIAALVMTSRAFGPLPVPKGHNERITLRDFSYSDIPDWAAGDVQNLIQAGVLTPTENGQLAPDDPVTVADVETILRRIFMLKGTNLRDDFYASQNRDFLAKSTIAPGEMDGGTMQTLEEKSTRQVRKIIEDLAANKHPKGSVEQKIADFYRIAANMEARNQMGSTPIQGYLTAIDGSQSLEDLLRVRQQVLAETGNLLLFGFLPTIDAKDSQKYSLSFHTLFPSLPQDLYTLDSGPQQRAFLNYLQKLFTLTGFSDVEAEQAANFIFQEEKALAENMLAQQEYGDVEKTYNVYSIQELATLFPDLDLENLLLQDGYQAAEYYIVQDPGILQAFAMNCRRDNLEYLRIFMRWELIKSFAGALSEDFEQASNGFQQEFYGVSGKKSRPEIAASVTQSILSDYLGKLYVEQYFSPEAKAAVEQMVQSLIGIYKSRIQDLSWMSPETKTLALKKLDTMVVKIGYPDAWEDPLAEVDILGLDEGGSYFAAICAIQRNDYQQNLRKQNQVVDRKKWGMPTYMVNAYYNPLANEICFPAAILQAPSFDLNASPEENLGGIGFVIAHEITHSFDNNGAKYDDQGNAANWWTEEDLQKFNERCTAAVQFYTGWESAPGIENNGVLTLSENIADLGAIACVVAAAAQLENPQYSPLFRNVAVCFARTGTREFFAYQALTNVHSANHWRVNRALQSSDAFYNAFTIQPGDGMYVPPEDRVGIW